MKSKYTKIFMIFAVVFAMFAALFVTPNFAYAEGEEEQVVTYTQETIDQITDSTVRHDLQAIISSMPDTAYISFPVTYESVYGNTIEWFDDESSSVIEYDTTGHWMVVNRSKDQDGTETVYVLVDKIYKYEFTISVPKGQTYVPEYTITYLDEDGKTELLSSATYKLGQKTFDLTSPATKEGHTFLGWYVEGDENQKVSQVVVGSMTDLELHAKWSTNEYTITFNSDGGSAVNSITQKYGTEVNEPATPTKEGYTFDAWYDSEGNKVTFPLNMPEDGLELHAKWNINTGVEVKYVIDGVTYKSYTGQYGDIVEVPANPTKEGYNFAGWDKTTPTTFPASSITITAQWTPNEYTIKYVDTDGTLLYEVTAAYGSEITAPSETPEKIGYEFLGWDQQTPNTMPLDGMTIKATWEKTEMLKLAEADREWIKNYYSNLLTGTLTEGLNEPLVKVVTEGNGSEVEWFSSNSAVAFDADMKLLYFSYKFRE